MPKYSYEAMDSRDKERGGVIEAPSEDLAREKLEEEGYVVLELAKIKEPINVEDILFKNRPVPAMALVVFSRQFATMIDSGLTPARALSVLEAQEENKKFKAIIGDVISKIEAGTAISDALAGHPDTFDEIYVAMIRVGESSGELDIALKTLATDLEKKAAMRRQIKSAMTYPKAVLAFAGLVVCGMLLTIVPKFAKIFQDAAKLNVQPGQPPPDDSLPAITNLVLGMSHLLFPDTKHDLLWFVNVLGRFAAIFLIVYVIRKIIRNILKQEGPRYRWDGFKLRAPMRVGPLIQKVVMARFSRTFASLLEAGVPPQEGLEIVSRTVGNEVVSEAILDARDRLLDGQTIAGTLRRSSAFPPLVVHMIEAGEEAGDIQSMLRKIAEFFEDEVDAQIKSLSSIVEPIMLILVGGIIGFVIIAIYMPILKIYDKVG